MKPYSAWSEPVFGVSALDVDDSVKSIVMKCVEQEPAHRYQTAEELAAALQAVLASYDDRKGSLPKLKRTLTGRWGKTRFP